MQLTERGRATLLRSTVEENGRDGVGATDGATLDLADIDLANNGDSGLEMDQFASGTLLNSTVSGNGAEGVQLGDSAELTLERNAIQNNHGFGVALHIWGCYGNQAADDRFHGKVAGRANTIPSRQADNGNKLGDVCPSALSFLTTDRGEAYPPSSNTSDTSASFGHAGYCSLLANALPSLRIEQRNVGHGWSDS